MPSLHRRPSPISTKGAPPPASSLTRLIRVMEEFRQLEPDLPTQVIHTFLVTANNPGLSIKGLQDRLGMSSSSASRAVAFLSERHRLGKDGLDLIRTETDPGQGRIKLVYLTAKGERLVERLEFFLGGA